MSAVEPRRRGHLSTLLTHTLFAQKAASPHCALKLHAPPIATDCEGTDGSCWKALPLQAPPSFASASATLPVVDAGFTPLPTPLVVLKFIRCVICSSSQTLALAPNEAPAAAA